MPLFSVIICTYNRYDFLPRAIASIQGQDIGAEAFDIWVMDNSPDSADRAAAAVRYRDNPNLHYVLLNRPGLSNARNEGVRLSSGEYLVFIDDDAEAAPILLRAYQEVFEKESGKIGVVGGKVEPVFGAAPPPWISPELLAMYSAVNWAPEIREMTPTAMPVGANFAVRRTACTGSAFLLSLGRQGSEAGNLLSGEEDSFFKAIRAEGWLFFYTPFASVLHHLPPSRLTQEWARRRVAWQAVTDQLKTPIDQDQMPILFSKIIHFLNQIPPEHRTFMGLLWDTQDPHLFSQQLDIIYALSKILLAAPKYPKELVFQKKD